ncbi:unnamed protein product, partial [Lepidochelys olivacea]
MCSCCQQKDDGLVATENPCLGFEVLFNSQSPCGVRADFCVQAPRLNTQVGLRLIASRSHKSQSQHLTMDFEGQSKSASSEYLSLANAENLDVEQL